MKDRYKDGHDFWKVIRKSEVKGVGMDEVGKDGGRQLVKGSWWS